MGKPWILVLCHEFPPLGGGAGGNACRLCRELTGRGLSVEVWTADPGAAAREVFPFPVEYVPTARTRRFETHARAMAAYVRGACALGRRARRDRPALILAVLGIPAGLAGAYLSRRLKAPLCVWHHGSDVHAGRPRGPGLLHRFLLRRVWARASVTFFVGPGLRDLASKMGRPPEPRLLPACPAPDLLAAAPASAPATAAAAGAEGYLLFLGRFDPVKRPLLLAEAAARLKAEGALARKIRFVGSGRLEGALGEAIARRGLAGQVSVEAAAPPGAVPDLLRSAYALVLPSRMEGFNTTLLEAAHFGVPAVAADTDGIRDFVRDGDTGLLFAEGDAGALAAALRKLMDDAALRDALGARAQAAAAPYRPARVADAFLAGLAPLVPAFGALAQEPSPWN